MSMSNPQALLSPDLIPKEIRSKIDKTLQKYPADQKQSAVKTALMLMQKVNGGHLTNEIMDAVALYLGMPKIAVYEVASFYTMFELKPVGRHKICICRTLSCMLCGGETIIDYLKEKLNVDIGEVTPDGKFSIKLVECLGACVGAPMMQIGDEYYENLTPEKIDSILEALD